MAFQPPQTLYAARNSLCFLLHFLCNSFITGVTIEQLEKGSRITVLVTFDTGLAVTVTVPENANAMSVIVLVPPNVKDRTSGLLGTWNDDTDDDVQTPAGEIIDAREDPYVLHNSYGITCKYQQVTFLDDMQI